MNKSLGGTIRPKLMVSTADVRKSKFIVCTHGKLTHGGTLKVPSDKTLDGKSLQLNDMLLQELVWSENEYGFILNFGITLSNGECCTVVSKEKAVIDLKFKFDKKKITKV